jgi:hypothetical protein
MAICIPVSLFSQVLYFRENIGGSIVYLWVEKIREILQEKEDKNRDNGKTLAI